MTKLFNLNRIEAVKVQFKKPIFEDDFPERGMKAWLTGIEVSKEYNEHYTLYFDFSAFEEENLKYFRQVYYPNIHTHKIAAETGRSLFTAIEAGCYNPKYSVYFGDTSWSAEKVEEELQKHLVLIE